MEPAGEAWSGSERLGASRDAGQEPVKREVKRDDRITAALAIPEAEHAGIVGGARQEHERACHLAKLPALDLIGEEPQAADDIGQRRAAVMKLDHG